MTIEERVDRLEAARGKNYELVIELRDAVTATLAVESRHGRAMKDHTEWLIAQDRAILEDRERRKALDQRISDLVSGIGELMRCG